MKDSLMIFSEWELAEIEKVETEIDIQDLCREKVISIEEYRGLIKNRVSNYKEYKDLIYG